MHKRPNPKTLFRILLVAIIAFATFELNGVEAFSNDLSGEPVHENITREALSFLKHSILTGSITKRILRMLLLVSITLMVANFLQVHKRLMSF